MVERPGSFFTETQASERPALAEALRGTLKEPARGILESADPSPEGPSMDALAELVESSTSGLRMA
jgi:hypothetical protein